MEKSKPSSISVEEARQLILDSTQSTIPEKSQFTNRIPVSVLKILLAK